MPRTYVKKRPVRYTEDEVKKAVDAVRKGKSVKATAKKYQIPYETLRNRAGNLRAPKNGRPTQECP